MKMKSKLPSSPKHTWAAAAASGLLLVGCPDQSEKETDAAAKAQPQGQVAPGAKDKSDKECCMGQNECKGKGGCAVPESHDCAGKNECKGKGGCNMHCPK